jgi:hypothetical protein
MEYTYNKSFIIPVFHQLDLDSHPLTKKAAKGAASSLKAVFLAKGTVPCL